MFSMGRRSRHRQADIWPGFVDALSSLLLVVIFVLMVFFIAQFYLSNALVGQDEALTHLRSEITKLSETLTHEKNSKETLDQQLLQLKTTLSVLERELGEAKAEQETTLSTLTQTRGEKEKALSEIAQLSQQIETLRAQLMAISAALDASEEKTKEKSLEMETLGERLNKALAEKAKELEELAARLGTSQEEVKTLDTKLKAALGPVGQYRSEFFAKLQEALGNRKEFRVVGDRFVFQSEILFSPGSDIIGEEGKTQLNQLSSVLKDITKTIPKDVQWILRIDGHTDHRPIKSPQFPSNWELSSARAIAVVQYLISQGIQPHRLVAAGFGEHQALETGESDEVLARNRRIEFKLDQR